jgi:crotonobetainyl-CoA:carnitine CoA-transferase CaiB-like acyl-CoA transferase
MTSAGPLQGLRVLDCSSDVAGLRTGGLMADFGADVILLEDAASDLRRVIDAGELAFVNREKRSVLLDVVRDRGDVDDLIRSVDVVVISGPDVRARAIDSERIRAVNPLAVTCQITAGGVEGDYADLPHAESVVHAAVGTMAEQLGFREGPVYVGIPFASIGAAYLATTAALAAIYRRSNDGRGRVVETSLVDGALAYMAMYWGESDAEPSGASSYAIRRSGPPPERRMVAGSFKCSDGRWIGVVTVAHGGFARLMEALGLSAHFPPVEGRAEMSVPLTPEQQRIIAEVVPQRFATDSSEAWERKLVAVDVCAIPSREPTSVFDELRRIERDIVVRLDDPVLGAVDQVGVPAVFAGTPARLRRPAPRRGEHTHEVLQEAIAERPLSWVGDGPSSDAPLLDGVTIVDLGIFIAGPFSSRILAGLGADVIKVESPGGDPIRSIPRIFRAGNVGKRSVVVDLKEPEGMAALRVLLEGADIVHHNFRPGVDARLGVDYASIKAINPSVIYGSAPGWGSGGPNRGRQSLEPHMSGYVGCAHESAGEGNEPIFPISNSDMGNGLLGAAAMMMALVHRARTGEGQAYENSHLRAALAHVGHIMRRPNGDVVGAGRLDSEQLGVSPLDRLYRTSDGWIVVSIQPDELCALAEAFDADESRLVGLVDDSRLADVVAALFSRHESGECVRRLRAVGLAAAEPVPYNNGAFMNDRGNRGTGRVAESYYGDGVGKVRELSRFVRISGSMPVEHRPAPGLGEHSDEVLNRHRHGWLAR